MKTHRQFDGTKIRETREELGWSRPDLVLKMLDQGLRVSEGTIINWESGETSPGVDDLAILSMVLGKPIIYFFVSQGELNDQVKNG